MHYPEQIHINEPSEIFKAAVPQFSYHSNRCIVKHVVQSSVMREDVIDQSAHLWRRH